MQALLRLVRQLPNLRRLVFDSYSCDGSKPQVLVATAIAEGSVAGAKLRSLKLPSLGGPPRAHLLETLQAGVLPAFWELGLGPDGYEARDALMLPMLEGGARRGCRR